MLKVRLIMCASCKTETLQISVGGQISIWKQYVYTHQQSFVYGLVSPTERHGRLAQEQCCADIPRCELVISAQLCTVPCKQAHSVRISSGILCGRAELYR